MMRLWLVTWVGQFELNREEDRSIVVVSFFWLALFLST